MEKFIYVSEVDYKEFIRALNRPIYVESYSAVKRNNTTKPTFVGKVIYEDPKVMVVRSKRGQGMMYKGMETYSIIKDNLNDDHYDRINKGFKEGGFIYLNIKTIPNNESDKARSRAFYLNSLEDTNKVAFNDVNREFVSSDYINY